VGEREIGHVTAMMSTRGDENPIARSRAAPPRFVTLDDDGSSAAVVIVVVAVISVIRMRMQEVEKTLV